MTMGVRFAMTALLAASAAASSTYVVDDNPGPGVDFTSISAAVAFATPGDVLLVRAGNYGAFTLDKELTILGAFGVAIAQGSRIENVASPDGVRMAELQFTTLEIANCAGPVLCDQVNVLATGLSGSSYEPALRVSASSDVRFQRSTIRGRNGSSSGDQGRLGAWVDGSRIEFGGCTLRGGSGADFGVDTDGGPGASALLCRNGSRAHLANTRAFGGNGGDACGAFCSGQDGHGGHAVVVEGASTLVVSGAPSIELRGGMAGDTWGNASDGWGVLAWNSIVRWSGVTIENGSGFSPGVLGFASTIVVPAQPDPTLELLGTPNVGQSVQIAMRGVAGQNARLQQGNETRLIVDGLSEIERLNNRIRLHPLGLINAAGEASMTATVASSMAPGWTRIFQGLQIDPLSGGLDERTNSVFVIVR